MDLATDRAGYKLRDEFDREVLGYMSGRNWGGSAWSHRTALDTGSTKADTNDGADELLATNKLDITDFGGSDIGGEAEVTECTVFCDSRLAGVVSTEPAHLMNDGIEGVAIALKGRVPCKVEGPVKKGDILVTGPIAGTATALRPDSATPSAWCVVGKSLENSDEAGIRLVEVAV